MYEGSYLAAGGLRYDECLDVEAPKETPKQASASVIASQAAMLNALPFYWAGFVLVGDGR